MNTPANVRITDGITVNAIPVAMLQTHQDQIHQVTRCTVKDLAEGRGLRVEEIVRIFRGNKFVGVSKKNLDALVATWILVWKEHGTF